MNIIQTWKSNTLPKQLEELSNKIKENNPNFKYLFFDDNAIINFMKICMPEYIDFFVNLKHKIQQIDFFRYLVVYYYGGIYLDLDIDINHNLDELYNNPEICKFPIELQNITDTIITIQGFNSLIGNYGFYAPKKHPFLKKIIDNIVNNRIPDNIIAVAQKDNQDPPEQVYVYCTTGPLLVTQTYIDYDNNDIELIKPEPFVSNCFGKYGLHRCYGTWKL